MDRCHYFVLKTMDGSIWDCNYDSYLHHPIVLQNNCLRNRNCYSSNNRRCWWTLIPFTSFRIGVGIAVWIDQCECVITTTVMGISKERYAYLWIEIQTNDLVWSMKDKNSAQCHWMRQVSSVCYASADVKKSCVPSEHHLSLFWPSKLSPLAGGSRIW